MAHCSSPTTVQNPYGASVIRGSKPSTIYGFTRSITTPCAGTVAEYSSPLNLTSLCVQRSLPFFGADFHPTSVHFTLIFSDSSPRLNIPIASPPSDSGLVQTSCSPD